MPRKSKTEQTAPANYYFMKLRGWQSFLDWLRAQPPSGWRDKRIDETHEKIMTYELFVRPIPRPGMTLEDERRDRESFERKCRDAEIAAGGKDPWADVPVYDGSPVV